MLHTESGADEKGREVKSQVASDGAALCPPVGIRCPGCRQLAPFYGLSRAISIVTHMSNGNRRLCGRTLYLDMGEEMDKRASVIAAWLIFEKRLTLSCARV